MIVSVLNSRQRDLLSDLTRVLDRHNRSLGRDMGWALKAGTTKESKADYAYDPATGRLASVADVSSSFAYGYVDHSQNLLQSITGPVHPVTNTFEANRDALLTMANRRNSDASDISSIGYTVNAIGQRTHATRTGAATNSTDWGYDSLGQVVQADDSVNTSDRAYQYDTIGNRQKSVNGLLGALPTAPNYVANALNQYTTIPQAPSAPVYDFDGNLTAGPLPVSPTANSTLAWDAENRLIETQVGRDNTLIRYQYDAQSRRISKTVNGAATTLYLYDGFNCIAEYSLHNSSFILHTSRLWGMDLSGTLQGAGGVGGLLCESQISNSQISKFYPAYDGNGNITEYLSTTGTIAAHFAYDPLGSAVVNTDTGNQFPYRFSTKPLDSETGLYYYNYRYYDPATGRWLSRDPIGEKGGLNLCSMARNHTTDFVDVLGMTDSSSCKCDKDIGSFKDITFTITTYTAAVNSYAFSDTAGTVKDYLKTIAGLASTPTSTTAMNGLITMTNSWVSNASTFMNAMGNVREVATDVTVMQIDMDTSLKVCGKNKSDEFVWFSEGSSKSAEPVKSITKAPKEAADAYKNLIVEVAEDIVSQINDVKAGKGVE